MNFFLQLVIYFFYYYSDEGNYTQSFKSIIEQLENDKKYELEKLEDSYGLLIYETKTKFKYNGLKANKEIYNLEEKFRIEMFNGISSIIYPKGSRFYQNIKSNK